METTFQKNRSEIIRVNPLNPRKSASYSFFFVTCRSGGSLTRGWGLVVSLGIGFAVFTRVWVAR
jgi:hypothetical protein